MSDLRDEFATAAMGALLPLLWAGLVNYSKDGTSMEGLDAGCEMIAKLSYKIADAMDAERARRYDDDQP